MAASQVAGSSSAATAAPWRAALQRSISQNANLPYAKYMQLASVRQDGRPANRTVVFRGFLQGADHLTFVTDARSRKVAEFAANPSVEVCWYFPSSREQYRLSGVVGIVAPGHGDEQLLQARQQAWAAMSDAGRSQFLWPQPGLPRMPMDEALFLAPAPESAGPAVDTFCLGVVQVHEVDHVDLYTNKRTVFTSSSSSSSGDDDGGSGADAPGAAPDGARVWSAASVNP